jgi:predicted transcriptional regulator
LTPVASGHTYHFVTHTDEARDDGRDDAGARGQSSPSGGPEVPEAKESRKERVLHTRVPAVLERELKRFAENLRIPVSNLVRTILEDALEVADAATENVEEGLKRAAGHLERERERLKKRMEQHDPLEGVVAFQEVTLATAASCARCENELTAGTRAHLGIGDGRDGPRVFVCAGCLPRA